MIIIMNILNLNTSHVNVNLILEVLQSSLMEYLNTSHVNVNQGGADRLLLFIYYLNTSHVNVNPSEW